MKYSKSYVVFGIVDNVCSSSFFENHNGCFNFGIHNDCCFMNCVSLDLVYLFFRHVCYCCFLPYLKNYFVCIIFVWLNFSLNKCFVFLKSLYGSFYFFSFKCPLSDWYLLDIIFSHSDQTSLLKILDMALLSRNCSIYLLMLSRLIRKWSRLLVSIFHFRF